jgi:hypothetical protein
MKRILALLACATISANALAQASPDPAPAPAPPSGGSGDIAAGAASPGPESKDARREVPILAYAYSASGVTAKTYGAQAYGLGLVASGQDSVIGGGGAIWGSPIDRLTLIVDGQRNLSRDFSPSAAAIVRILGDGREGFTLGGLGKYKIDGFGKGPEGEEVESELEAGALMSYASAGWHLDLNAIYGVGLGDEGEMDAEGRLRVGYDLGNWARVGIDSQARRRLAGPLTLPNGRSWDFAAGPQFMAYSGNFFGAVTTGPTTMGLISDKVGYTALVSVGGTTF